MSDQVAAEVPIEFIPSSSMSRFSFVRNSLTLLVVALLLVDNGPSVLAVKHCKNAVMDIIMKHCSGARFARDVEHVDSTANAGSSIKSVNPEDGAAPEEAEASATSTHDKRQVSLETASALAAAAPVVLDVLQGGNGIYRGQYDTYNQYPYDRIPGGYYPHGVYPTYGGYGYVNPVTNGGYGVPHGGVYPPGFQGAADSLGMDLTSNEVEELYEVYERMPRASMRKEDAKKLFIEMAAKCCQNLNRCVLDEKFIPCT